MEHNEIIELAAIVGLAVGAQLLATWLRLPSILLLIVAGFVAGPLTGWIDPTDLFGDLLLPLVSLAVAVILFEGGLTLDLRELRDGVPGVVVRLLTLGLAITWALGGLFAYFIFDLSVELSVLLGAVLVVSGPTVILPILRQIRLGGRVESVLRWEGIVVDPIGVLLAVLVFEAVVARQRPTAGEAFVAYAETIGVGTLVGLAGAGVLVLILRRGGLDDHLRTVVTLGTVIVAFGVADFFAAESGLLSAVLMGLILANWPGVDLRQIQYFKESIGLLLIGLLFVILTARVPKDAIADLWLEGLLYLGLLVVLVRPLAVWVSTFSSNMNWRERALLAVMAPRGIVAAASVSLFAVALAERQDLPGADQLVPIAFIVIIGTVAISGLSAGPVARALGLVRSGPERVLIVGAQPWARRVASELYRQNIPVLLWAMRRENADFAASEGIEVRSDDLLAESRSLDVDFEQFGTALILTSNDEFNGLVAERLREEIEPDRIFQIATREESRLLGRRAFEATATFENVARWIGDGARVRALSFGAGQEYEPREGDVPLLIVRPGASVTVVVERADVEPKPGEVLVVLQGARDSESGEAGETGSGPERIPGAASRAKMRRLRRLSQIGRRRGAG